MKYSTVWKKYFSFNPRIYIVLFVCIVFSTQVFSQQSNFPWSVNVDINHTEKNGYKSDAKLQQGISWGFPNSKIKFVPFVETKIIQSSKKDDYWNNVFEPAVGLKFRYGGSAKGKVKWREINFGIRRTKYEYTSKIASDDQILYKTEVFLNVYASGKW